MKAKTLVTISIMSLLAVGLFAEETVYELFVDGRLAGMCTIDINRRGGGFLIQKQATLTDRRGEREVEEEIVVDSDYLPRTYELRVTSPEGKLNVTGAFSETGVTFSGKMGMGSMSKVLESAENLGVWSEEISMSCQLLLLKKILFLMKKSIIYSLIPIR